MTDEPQVFLASNSPRRKELLSQMGIKFTQIDIAIPELRFANESCDDYIVRLAIEKSRAGIKQINDTSVIVIGADTVILNDGEIFEKPKNEEDAKSMLTLLSDNTHVVKTAVAVSSDKLCQSDVQTSYVTMRRVTAIEMSEYWESGEPVDKAGGYAIQGKGAMFIKHIAGSYSGIMGLPIYETAQLLNKFNVKTGFVPR